MVGVSSSALGAQLVPQANAVGRSEAMRAAQKAFFQAALNAPAPSGQAAAAPQPAGPARVSAGATGASGDEDAADGVPRPGSLVDIRV